MISRSKLGKNVIDFILGVTWANNNKIIANSFNLRLDEIIDTAHEAENQNDTSNTDGDAKAGQE
jgi:hypothetical protein